MSRSSIARRTNRDAAGRGLWFDSGASRIRLLDRQVLRLGAGEERTIGVLVLVGLGVSATFVAQSVVLASLLAEVIEGGSPSGIVWLIGALAGLLIARFGFVYLTDAIGASASARIAARLRDQLFDKLTRLGPSWVQTRRTGELQFTLVDGVEKLEQYFSAFVARAITIAISTVVVVAALFWLDPVVGSVVGAGVALAAFGPVISWRVLGSRLAHWWTTAPALSADYVDNMQGIVTLKSFDASGSVSARLRRRTAEVYRANMKLLNAELGWLQPFTWIEAYVVLIVVVVVGGLRVEAGAIAAPALLFVLLLTGEALRPVAELKRSLHFSMQGMGAAGTILDVLEAEEPETPSTLTAAELLEPRIELDDVTFSYRPGDRPALDGVSLQIEPGERVAVVGRSGAGKTTLVSLLLRFLDPDRGAVRIGGVDIRSLPIHHVRAQMSLVSQETYLFHGSVADNLRLARVAATEAELRRALDVASCGFVDDMPDGLATVIGERGVRLSGGQRQRLAIARAVLADAPILLLDEATSSLDVANEADIHDALRRVTQGRTVIIVAHRLATVRNADRIVVLDRGRVVQQGSHHDLIGGDGLYRSLTGDQR